MTPREWLRRLAGAFGVRRRDRDLRDELAFHREMLEARHRERGLDPAAARRAAAIELGGEPQLAEEWRDQRGLPFLDMLRQDVAYGLRALRRTPGFTVAAFLTLAIGIGANASIFSIVDAVLLRPLPYDDPDRLVVVGDQKPDGSLDDTGTATVNDWRQRSRSFEQLAMIRPWMPTLVVDGEGERLAALRVSANYLATLGARPAVGRGLTPDDDRPDGSKVVLLSDALWRRRFHADLSVVGRAILLNDREFRIIGVMPASFESLDAERFFGAPSELWAPLGGDQERCRNHCRIQAVGRLAPGVSPAAAASDMNRIRGQLLLEYPDDYGTGRLAAVPLRDVLTGRARTALYVLLAAVGFVLLIACANVAGLLLARSVARQRELSIRVALGAGRRRIVQQLLTESVMLGLAGAAGGAALVAGSLRFLVLLAPVTLPRLDHVTIDGRVLAFATAAGVLSSVLFGLVPAWQGARGPGGRRSRGRAVLVVANLALALVLLASAGVMLRTIGALMRIGPGFDPSRVLTLQFVATGSKFDSDAAILAFQDRALEAIRRVPGVERAALAGQIPFARAAGGSGDCWGFHAEGRMKPNPADDPCVERFGTTPDYLAVMQISVIAGRSFTPADTSGAQPVILISQSTAKTIWGELDPLGSRVRIGRAAPNGRWWTVVGVVSDVHLDDLSVPVAPAMYTPEPQIPSAYLTAVVRGGTGDASSLAAPLRTAFRELDPTVPIHAVAPLSALVARSAAQRRFVMELLAGFAVAALLLAATGLYGVVAYGVAQRRREVGVRMALGARRQDVMRLILAGGLRLVALGVFVGLPAAAVGTHLLGSLVFGVSPLDPPTFAAAAALLIVVGLLAHLIPVRRALRIDPVSALRSE